ncbi:phage major capsid protein [Sphingomonas sp. RRHST34]|uniref:Phage major capsid protein n=1 Tax=Sphingomonas citri TaxID=2862499 RepID=A0ABS7BQX5_9SPHN|nr:phage major capsid protein [Sphingomonas citri]MBW6531920.1 phage major capsid protein [Sphingomonas citri]
MKHVPALAMLAGSTALAMPRAIAASSIRADANDPVALIGQINTTLAAMRAKQDELSAKVDPLDVAQIATMNASISTMQSTLDGFATEMAAARLGQGNGPAQPENPEYTAAFMAHVRRNEVSAAMSVGSNPDGGYTAPVEWDRTIQGRLKLISPMRQHATVETVGTAGFVKLFSDRAVGSGWVGETASRPATNTPQLSPLTFGNGEIYAFPFVTQQLLDDSQVDIEQWLSGEVATEFDRQEAIAFLSGNGVNKPQGLLNYVTGGTAAAIHPWGDIKSSNSGTAAAIDKSDAIVKLVYSLPTAYQGNAKFFANLNTHGALRLMKDGQGNYLWQPSYQAGQPATLMGRPLVEMPDMPDVAAGSFSLLYGDMAETYLILDRIGVRVIRDALTNKPFIGFYTTKRVGGGVKNPDAMKALKTSA